MAGKDDESEVITEGPIKVIHHCNFLVKEEHPQLETI